MPPKGAQYTTMTDKIRIALCEHHDKNPQLSQKDLNQWLEQKHKMKVSQPTISGLLKRKATILAKADNSNLDAKRQKMLSILRWNLLSLSGSLAIRIAST